MSTFLYIIGTVAGLLIAIPVAHLVCHLIMKALRSFVLQNIYKTSFAIVKVFVRGNDKPTYRITQKFLGFWLYRDYEKYSTLTKAEMELRKSIQELKRRARKPSYTVEKTIDIEEVE